MSPYPYYLFLLLEQLSLLWFAIHPNLGIFGDVFLLDYARLGILFIYLGLKVINFYEFMTDEPNLYVYMVAGVMGYFIIQIIFLIISVTSIQQQKAEEGEAYKYVRKIVNFQFLISVKVLSGPMLGLAVNVLYCIPKSPYHLNQTCYDTTHLIFCVLSAVILLIVIVEVAFFSLIYYIKNPLTTSYLGQQNRYFMISKTILKLIMPVYFAVDYSLSLSLVFMFLVAGLYGVYLFWHRFLSVHTYEQKHFYVEYFMEATVFWVAVNNILSYYIEGNNADESMGFIYALLSALLIGLLLVNVERSF